MIPMHTPTNVAHALTSLATITTTVTPARNTGRTVSSLNALIYGWDDADDDNTGNSNSKSSTTPVGKPLSTYFDDTDTTYTTPGHHHNNDNNDEYTWGQACSPTGAALAESLSVDRDREGSLARLAVAFSPPDRQLQLDAIQSVDVICVSETHIDIQAMVCDGANGGGCVSLAVPVQFPQPCSDWQMEGCVVQNLDQLDEQHEEHHHQQRHVSSTASAGFNTLPEYPVWWVEATDSSNPLMPAECDYMTSILNEDEFQPELISLAQDSLNQASTLSGVFPTSIQQAKIVKMGPGGMLFQCKGANSPLLNVFSPFSNGPLHSIEAMRAAVLGSVATAGS
mmetsp:Transcript_3681/g.7913  ORF Transcript_3681/g.7913 Transcript_3681/m.7913 type:complete len:338 (+) Transcript_3681:1-1014(+)